MRTSPRQRLCASYGDAMSTVELISVGDLVNVRGVPDRNAAGGIEVGVSDPSDITLLTPVSRPNDNARTGESSATPSAERDTEHAVRNPDREVQMPSPRSYW